MVEVTQSDREMGAILLVSRLREAGLSSFAWAEKTVNDVRYGLHDKHYYVQMSATHRIQSTAALQSELDAAKAEIERLRGAMKRAADIVDRNLGRQNEKVGDASYVLRQALGDSHV